MTENNQNTHQVEASVSQVQNQVREMLAGEEKNLRWALIIKLIVLAAVALYLPWAYSAFRPVNSDFIVFVAQEKIQEALPQAKTQMAGRLTRMAPAVVDQVSSQVVKNLPQVEQGIEAAAKSALLNLSESHEKELVGWISEFMLAKKQMIDEMFPNMSSYQKISTMRQYVLDDCRKAIEGVSEEVGDKIEGHSFTQQLRRLALGRNLTEKEKMQREILALWYVLVQKKIGDLEIK